MKFIDKNSEFEYPNHIDYTGLHKTGDYSGDSPKEMTHRWLGISQDLPHTMASQGIEAGDEIKITWWQKTDTEGKGANVGLYHYLKSSDGRSFGEFLQFIPCSKVGVWEQVSYISTVEEDWEVFYAGWDATENYPLISCGVHHPGGTPKKINYDDDTAYGAWWDTASHGLTHWQVNWDEGGSEGGSSGSPIFNERFQIVGVLTGGAGECGEGWPDLYGKFYLGWNWEMDQNRRMIDWLDPDYTGTLVIDGTYVEVTGLTGDLNSDDAVNILDIIQLANMILSGEYADNADLNSDGTLNILDIISLANIILGS